MGQNNWKDTRVTSTMIKQKESILADIFNALLQANGLKLQYSITTHGSSHGREYDLTKYRVITDTVSYMKDKKENNE